MTAEVNQVACEKTKSIQKITNQMKMLALNALIESSRAGAQGAGFAVVAQEVRNVGQQVETIARELESQLTNRTGNLMTSIAQMADRSRGERMVDLSLNAIELIDRNLYERTCDVRWWATDSAVVDCAAAPDAAAVAHVSERLAVILGAYTVYLDLWLCDLDGNVLANGRADRFNVVGQNVASTKWFRAARALRSGDDYAAGDVECQPLLGNAQVATYCASVRAGGKANGKPTGVLAIHFDWEPQARAIVQGVRVGAADKARVLLVDSNFRVIAASDGQGLLTERVSLPLEGRRSGFYQDRSGALIAFHATPGYETYKGLGWFGVIQAGAGIGAREVQHPSLSAMPPKSLATMSQSPLASKSYFWCGPYSVGRATKAVFRPILLRGFQVAVVGGDHHHLLRRQAEQFRRAEIGFRIGLVVLEQFRRHDEVPRQAGELRHVGQQRDVAVGERRDDVFLLQPRQPRHAVRPRMQAVPAHGEVVQIGLAQSLDRKLRDQLFQRSAGAAYPGSDSRARDACAPRPSRPCRRRASRRPTRSSRP